MKGHANELRGLLANEGFCGRDKGVWTSEECVDELRTIRTREGTGEGSELADNATLLKATDDGYITNGMHKRSTTQLSVKLDLPTSYDNTNILFCLNILTVPSFP